MFSFCLCMVHLGTLVTSAGFVSTLLFGVEYHMYIEPLFMHACSPFKKKKNSLRFLKKGLCIRSRVNKPPYYGDSVKPQYKMKEALRKDKKNDDKDPIDKSISASQASARLLKCRLREGYSNSLHHEYTEPDSESNYFSIIV